jgi:hypothetical protein
MKQVIELLEEALDIMLHVTGLPEHYGEIKYVRQAIAELKFPRWYTPEQWEERTGKAWPDDWAVYWRGIDFSSRHDDWKVASYGMAKVHSVTYLSVECVCATEAGPPPDDWKPEEETK